MGRTPEDDGEGVPDGAFPPEDFRVPDATEQEQEPTRLVLQGLLGSPKAAFGLSL